LILALKKTYFFTGAAAGFGAAGVVFSVVFGAADCDASIILLLSLNDPVKLKLESNTKTIKAPANTQVLLSKKSVVF
jgi:hypothetical protein